jgi:hypothetical protein
MTKEFNEERARKLTVQSIDQTVMLLKVNRDACVNVLKSMGAPSDAAAGKFLAMMTGLLNAMASSVEQGAEVLDATEVLAKVKGDLH